MRRLFLFAVLFACTAVMAQNRPAQAVASGPVNAVFNKYGHVPGQEGQFALVCTGDATLTLGKSDYENVNCKWNFRNR